MFNQQNNEEKKLDWMYKGPNSMVEREEYLLGRKVDKTLEQLNEEDKQKQQGIILPPKNRVEHECIPPSIRDFNKVVQAEQVDLSTKLQEDPLVAIKKREEETRRQFLQNPVQLKKLQKALKAQQAKKKKKKKKKSKGSTDSDSDLETKLAEKLLGKKKKISKEERDLDTILIHKFEALKDKLTESDLQDILSGNFTDSEDSSEDEKSKKKSKKRRDSSDDSDDNNKHKKKKEKRKKQNPSHEKRRRSRSPPPKKATERRKRSSSSSSESEPDSDNSDYTKNKRRNYGLVSSDGKKLTLSRKHTDVKETKSKPKLLEPPPKPQHKARKLTEEEKEKLRQEMMHNAVQRDKERERNVRRYRENEEKERREQNFDPDFIHKQLLKTTSTSSVESRIKSNLNNIQRSSRAMDKHFSRR